MSSRATNPYKMVILGDGGVGKSALSVQFMQNHFISDYDPTIENSYQKTIMLEGEVCVVDLLDTAGQEEYAVMRNQYMQAGQGFLLAYSINNRDTFQSIPNFHEQIQDVKNNACPIVLIGNKSDLEDSRLVSLMEGQSLASKLGQIPFFEASAKDRVNVVESFQCLLRAMVLQRRRALAQTSASVPTKNKTGGCCILA